MNRVEILVFEDEHFALRRLYARGINVYNIENNVYTVDEKDLDKISLDYEIINYSGIKKLKYKIKSNIHFLIALILSIALLFLASSMVVSINVIHSDKHIREIIKEELYDYGVHPFMLKKSFDELQEIKNHIKDDYPENIEWLEIIDEGMKYTVRVEERIITREEEKPTYCDIVSKSNAIVLTSKVSSGQSLTVQNDFVKPGDILISGAVKFNDNVKSYVCAEAEVYGNTWYTVSVSIPYNYEKKTYTGKEHKNISFEFGSNRTSIFKVHFDEYDTERKAIFSIGRLTIYREIDKEYTKNVEVYSEEEIREEALKKGRSEILNNLDDKAIILNEKVLQTETFDSIIEMDIFYSVKEIIGRQEVREIPNTSEEVTGNDELTG